jgi:hypothetical protein
MDIDGLSEALKSVVESQSLYEIDSGLVDEWQALPKTHRFSPVLPRLAWDKLYRAIELLNENSIVSGQVALDVINGEVNGLKDTFKALANNAILTQNFLRQFQEMLMQAAIDEGKMDGDHGG